MLLADRVAQVRSNGRPRAWGSTNSKEALREEQGVKYSWSTQRERKMGQIMHLSDLGRSYHYPDALVQMCGP